MCLCTCSSLHPCASTNMQISTHMQTQHTQQTPHTKKSRHRNIDKLFYFIKMVNTKYSHYQNITNAELSSDFAPTLLQITEMCKFYIFLLFIDDVLSFAGWCIVIIDDEFATFFITLYHHNISYQVLSEMSNFTEATDKTVTSSNYYVLQSIYSFI